VSAAPDYDPSKPVGFKLAQYLDYSAPWRAVSADLNKAAYRFNFASTLAAGEVVKDGCCGLAGCCHPRKIAYCVQIVHEVSYHF
jgi:hypothetical protein